MTLTQALHYYNKKKRPTNEWMETGYSHFCPSEDDKKVRKELHTQEKPKKVKPKVKRRKMKEFE